MRDYLVQTAPRLRRYAHALLGSWPIAQQGAERRLRADQDADDLAHQALLGFWRAGFGPPGSPRVAPGAGLIPSPTCICPDDALTLALYRRVTSLARQSVSRQPDKQRAFGDSSDAMVSPFHTPWAPEARALPRLPFELRALIGLVAIERLSHQQAAEALDLRESLMLPRLAVARAQFSTEISGERRAHLVLAEADQAPEMNQAVTERDLLLYVDDLLDRSRREDVGLFLKSRPDAARRVSEWLRNDERLRRAFEPLMREPLPPALNFSSPNPARLTKSRGVKRRGGLFSGLASLLAASAGRQAPSPRAY